MGFGSDELGFRILILQFGQVISPEYQFNHVYIKDEKTYVIEMWYLNEIILPEMCKRC